MKSYTIRFNNAQHTVVAATPRTALWLAVQCRAIDASAWCWMKQNKAEGHYGPLSITQNQASQLVLPLRIAKEY